MNCVGDNRWACWLFVCYWIHFSFDWDETLPSRLAHLNPHNIICWMMDPIHHHEPFRLFVSGALQCAISISDEKFGNRFVAL